MDWNAASAIGWLFHGRRGASDRLIPRWLFLRGLGSIYFSAFFFSHLSDPRAHRSSRDSACGKPFASSCPIAWALAAIVVRADFALVLERCGHAACCVLGGNDRLAATGVESVAARHACCLFRL